MCRDIADRLPDSDSHSPPANSIDYRKRGFPRGGSLAGAATLRIHSLLRRGPRNTTHFGCRRPSSLVVAERMIIGARSVTYTFVAPLGWGEKAKIEIKRATLMKL
jgi:hypothetical protein